MTARTKAVSRNYYLGIDPGLDGAVALLSPSGALVWAMSAPTTGKGKREFLGDEMAAVIQGAIRESEGALRCVIEKVTPMPRQGLGSTFRFGEGYGRWLGILDALGVPYERMTPQTWQRIALRDVPGGDTKAKAEVAARARHRCADWSAWNKKQREGVFDALGIAEAGRREGGE